MILITYLLISFTKQFIITVTFNYLLASVCNCYFSNSNAHLEPIAMFLQSTVNFTKTLITVFYPYRIVNINTRLTNNRLQWSDVIKNKTVITCWAPGSSRYCHPSFRRSMFQTFVDTNCDSKLWSLFISHKTEFYVLSDYITTPRSFYSNAMVIVHLFHTFDFI